ncbi:hypothetical protein [Clostridium neonatale]|uniref:hypothetical protein n=1 Tax=Clostridium neonatale TaxID=137838 RepID=UPI00291B7854|nr:conserved hypothetical protein [Clostridium neonatale]
MIFEVENKLKVGKNTAVTIRGSSDVLKNGIKILNEDNKEYLVISIGMPKNQNTEDILKHTELLVEGEFSGNTVIMS